MFFMSKDVSPASSSLSFLSRTPVVSKYLCTPCSHVHQEELISPQLLGKGQVDPRMIPLYLLVFG